MSKKEEPMNTIDSAGYAAMDGRTLYNSMPVSKSGTTTTQQITPDRAQAAQFIEQNIQQVKSDSQQLQKMSELVTGRKLLFNVNKELGSVVVTVVDSNTNKVVKQIPSEDMQNLKIRIRKAIGSLFDDLA